jgi:hypothetical protein
MKEKLELSDPLSLFDKMGAENAPRDTVTLPNGQTMLVRGLTSQEYGTVQAEMRDEGDVDWQASAPLYLVFGALKPDGKQAFEMSDIGKIMNTPRALIQPMLDKILDLTGVSNDANKILAKNWSKMTAVASSLGSPATSASTPGR